MPRKKKSVIKQSKYNKPSFLNEFNDNIIICLPIQLSDIQLHSLESSFTKEQNLYVYKPEMSIPMEQESNDVLCCEWVNKEACELSKKTMEETKKPLEKQILNDTSKHTYFENSQVCMWCCHAFSTSVVNLPLLYNNKEYVVFGQYCSAECAAAYNFHDIVEYGDIWERYSLLHSLYYEKYMDSVIRLAPTRLSLKMFGGHLTIEKFRNYNMNNNNQYKISLAPVKHIKVFSSDKTYNITSKTENTATTKLLLSKNISRVKHPFSFFHEKS